MSEMTARLFTAANVRASRNCVSLLLLEASFLGSRESESTRASLRLFLEEHQPPGLRLLWSSPLLTPAGMVLHSLTDVSLTSGSGLGLDLVV